MNGEQPLALTLWLLARFVGNHVACWEFQPAASASECFPKVVLAQTQKVDHSAKALNALFPKPIGTDAIALARTKNSANFRFESCISTDTIVLTRR